MNTSPLVGTVKQISIGLVLVFFVVLLTLLFSFLGTITCSVLMGMMIGSTRQWRWQIIPVSLVFPAVIMGFHHAAKTDLTLPQGILVAALCFGGFWLSYLATAVLMWYEKRNKTLPENTAEPAAVLGEASVMEPAAQIDLEKPGDADASAVSLPPSKASALAELQGTWRCETPGQNGKSCTKVIEVVRDQVAMNVVNSLGQVQAVSKGGLQLERLGPFNVLKVVHPTSDQSMNSAQRSEVCRSYIYKICGQTLTIAADFEDLPGGREPRSENFVRSQGVG